MGIQNVLNSPRTYNALALFGQITVGMQGLSSLALAVAMLITGSMLMGSKYEISQAIVDSVVCDDGGDICGVGVTYVVDGKTIKGTMDTVRPTAYTPGDSVSVRYNPVNPEIVYENLPWVSMGFGLVTSALALGVIAWFLINLVSDDRNIAALAGSLSFLRLLFV